MKLRFFPFPCSLAGSAALVLLATSGSADPYAPETCVTPELLEEALRFEQQVNELTLALLPMQRRGPEPGAVDYRRWRAFSWRRDYNGRDAQEAYRPDTRPEMAALLELADFLRADAQIFVKHVAENGSLDQTVSLLPPLQQRLHHVAREVHKLGLGFGARARMHEAQEAFERLGKQVRMTYAMHRTRSRR